MSNKNLGKIFLFSKNYDFSQIKNGTGARYSDGSGYFDGDDGTRIQIYSDGSGYYEGPDGSSGQIYSDGSGHFEGKNGSSGQKYSDGSGYFEDENGEREDYYSEEDYEEDDDENDEDESTFSLGAKIGEGLAGVMYGYANSSREKPQRDSKKDIIFFCIYFIFMIIIVAFCLFMAFWYSTPKDGEIKVTINAKDYIGVNYMEVEQKMKNMGFTNVKCVPKGDLITGWLNKEGETDKITINNSKFKKDDIFPADADVVITYHSFKDD